MDPTSDDLHPATGARFRFERRGEGCYRVEVFLPASSWSAELDLGAESLEPEPPEDAGWTVGEVHKLARVLRRDEKPRLIRWRPSPA